MQVLIWLDTIITFTVLMRIKYNQLGNKSINKIIFFFSFFLSSSYKFHCSSGEICGSQSQIFMIRGKEA